MDGEDAAFGVVPLVGPGEDEQDVTGARPGVECDRRGVSMYDDDQYSFEALRAGASGHVLESVADRDLLEPTRRTSEPVAAGPLEVADGRRPPCAAVRVAGVEWWCGYRGCTA